MRTDEPGKGTALRPSTMPLGSGARPWLGLTLLAGMLVMVTGCSKGDDNPEPPTRGEPRSAHAASGVEAPFASIVPADAQPPETPGTSGHANAGAEASPSKSVGPGNGSTAVGGVAGGQATGTSSGGAPQPSAGDGRASTGSR